MAMGTVDNLGQFKSDFNPHPDTEKAKGTVLIYSKLFYGSYYGPTDVSISSQH